ncbi:hypothetical protein ACOMHN_008661 [Nucella lapillus]
MAEVSSEDMDTVNNNTMSNNNNSSNINNNTAAGLTTGDIGVVVAATAPGMTCGTGSANMGDATTTPTVCSIAANATNSSGSERSSRSSSSRRSHSRGRSRSHSRHRRSHHSGSHSSRHHSRHNRKSGERNFPAALCSMISIVILCTALAEPRWVSIDNGHCVLPKGRPLSYLGVFQFFSVGYIVYNDPDINHNQMNVIVEYRFGSGEDDRMINCVTERAVIIFKIIIGFTFLGIFTSLVSFGLDLIGSSHKLPRLLRRNAIFNVFTVFVCVGITLFLYLATVDICRVQQQIPDSNATVSFDVSFHLVAAAGFISVIGVACTCLRRVRPEPESVTARSILDDQFNQDIEQLVSVPAHGFVGPDLPPLAAASQSALPPPPPPPPYTP